MFLADLCSDVFIDLSAARLILLNHELVVFISHPTSSRMGSTGDPLGSTGDLAELFAIHLDFASSNYQPLKIDPNSRAPTFWKGLSYYI